MEDKFIFSTNQSEMLKSMDAQLKTALHKLARPMWRLEWRDYRVFEEYTAYYLESAEHSEYLSPKVAEALIAAGYVTEVRDDDPREWRKTFTITPAGRAALTGSNN
jgi:hypothetical protein